MGVFDVHYKIQSKFLPPAESVRHLKERVIIIVSKPRALKEYSHFQERIYRPVRPFRVVHIKNRRYGDRGSNGLSRSGYIHNVLNYELALDRTSDRAAYVHIAQYP
jgi:hypothetical protein